MFSPLCNVALVFLALGIAGSSARAPSRIVGGTDAAPAEFPWQASIRAYDVHLCGGTIISTRHILTAGHCIIGVVEPPFSEMTVVVGIFTLRPGTGKTYRVKDVAVHNQYAARTSTTAVKHDIAVIALRKEMEVNEFQKPAALPTLDILQIIQGVVSGFGRTGRYEKPSQILQKLPVQILPSSQCIENGIRVQKYQLCAFNSAGTGTCKGDSGGPLVIGETVVGIVSTSPIQCGIGTPDVYTKVFYYKSFIEGAMKKL